MRPCVSGVRLPGVRIGGVSQGLGRSQHLPVNPKHLKCSLGETVIRGIYELSVR